MKSHPGCNIYNGKRECTSSLHAGYVHATSVEQLRLAHQLGQPIYNVNGLLLKDLWIDDEADDAVPIRVRWHFDHPSRLNNNDYHYPLGQLEFFLVGELQPPTDEEVQAAVESIKVATQRLR